ncbi:MAG: two-component regulator propeller domain-containing protein [Bacteroidales bacterium]
MGVEKLKLVGMRHLRLVVLFSVVTALLTANCYPQSLGSNVRFFNIEDGLSHSAVNFLLIDSKGFLWIATSDGLNRYDGYSFVSFKHMLTDTTSLCDNYVRHLCEDREGNIWVATSNGLSYYVRSQGSFINYYHDPGNPRSLSSNNVFYVYQDRQGDVWVKTIETLEKFNTRTREFTHYRHYNDVFNFASNDFFFSIYEDHKGRLWVGTKDGLNFFDRQLEIFRRYEWNPRNPSSISDNRIKTICEDKAGNLWIGTENGLNLFNPASGKFTRFFHDPHNPNSLVNNVINDMFFDEEGVLWIATMDGFCSYNPTTHSFQAYRTLQYKGITLPLTGISTLVKDKANNLWIGSYEGLTMVDLKPYKFGLFPIDSKSYSINVTAVSLTDANEIWLGTRRTVLIHLRQKPLSKDLMVVKSYDLRPLLFDGIFAIFPYDADRLWLGTSNGIYEFNKSTGSAHSIRPEQSAANFLANNLIYAFYLDKRNILWVGSEYGLHQFDRKTNRWQPYVHLPDSQSSAIHSVRCFAGDDKGNLWMGTDDGLICYNIDTREYKKYLSNPRKTIRSLPSNSVYSLLYSRNKQLWVGTNAGLCRYNPASDDFRVLTEVEGLPNNTIYAMQDDAHGNIWMSTNKGIIKFEPDGETFTSFDQADGLQGYEFNLGASAQSANDQIFFGGVNGLNFFYPDSIKPYSSEPSTVITALEIVSVGIKRMYSISPGMEITIPARTKLFTFYFASLDFTYPANNRYMYKLSSSATDGLWISLGNKNYVQFSNLRPGNYVLQVKGSSSDQVWSSEPFMVRLIVETPFYKSTWAIFIYVMMVMSSVFFFIRWRTNRLIQENRELQERNAASIEINRQKEELAVKNKNITDSINYARRIQMAMFPSERNFRRILPNSFVYHRPKDIVSGDFYWIHEKADKIFLAVVDCTGHGVPGAFMSILGIELLRNLMNTNVEDPGMILDSLNEEFSRVFAEMDDMSLKDGMDVSFCTWKRQENMLLYAGAEHVLYYARNNQIFEVKGDRFSVGIKPQDETVKFTTHTIQLFPNDMVYLFSDGYADQFGGPDGKKFKYRRFRHMLLNIYRLPLDQQKQLIDDTFELWKGNQEQVDDILIVGFRA